MFRHEHEGAPVRMGNYVGGGMIGRVYMDALDNNFVYKTMNAPTARLYLTHECKWFREYYGEGSAQIIKTKKGDFLLRMARVPGIPIEKAKREVMNPHMDNLISMVDRMDDKGIIHDDFNTGNILFDVKTGSFYPIDIGVTEGSDHTSNRRREVDIDKYNVVLDYYMAAAGSKVRYSTNERGKPALNQDGKPVLAYTTRL